MDGKHRAMRQEIKAGAPIAQERAIRVTTFNHLLVAKAKLMGVFLAISCVNAKYLRPLQAYVMMFSISASHQRTVLLQYKL